MECLLSENLPDLDGPVLFMAPYWSQKVLKNEFWWRSQTSMAENVPLLLWPLIAILSIISHPEALTPEIGSKNLGASPPMAYKAWTKPLRPSGRCLIPELMYSSKAVCTESRFAAVGSTVAHFTTLGARKFTNRATRICINFCSSSNYVATRARGKWLSLGAKYRVFWPVSSAKLWVGPRKPDFQPYEAP